MATSPDGCVLPSNIRGSKPVCTSCWGTWVGGCCCTMSSLVGPWLMAGWPLCEQSAGLDGPLV